MIQAEQELADHRADRAHRRETGLSYAHAVGLGEDEGPLFEVMAYSPDLGTRLAAGELMVDALQRLATAEGA